jgi:hypothetical protein
MVSQDPSRSLWIPIILGTTLFIALGGLSILVPSNIGWLMRGFWDPPSHQLGWEFFRHTPWLQFPLGANPDYGMALGSSIVFSDSLPLFSLPFKFLSPLLPDIFQYFGLWVLCCFVLQSVFAHLLLSRFTSNRWLLLLGASLLLLMPSYLMRTTIHLALAGQWLLLAGFYLYFSAHFKYRFWVGLLVVATLIHAYLLVMAGAIWAADLLQRLLKREHSLGTTLVRLAAGIVPVIFVMWLLGYFMLGPSPVAPGEYLRMNALALFDSRGGWSRLIPDFPLFDVFDGDGFAYMGAGMLALLAFAIALACQKATHLAAPHVIWPLLLMSLCLLLVALTNKITFGPYLLLQFDLPEWMIRAYQVFRSPGRFFWPVYYLLSVVAIALVCLRLKPAGAILVLALALIVQLYDLSKTLPKLHANFSQESDWKSTLIAPMWEGLGKRYEKVLYVPANNMEFAFLPLAEFAKRHRIAVNIGNFARYDLAKHKDHQEELLATINSGKFDPRAIYIFRDIDIWHRAQSNMGPDDQAGLLDGFKLVIPGFKKCLDCQRAGFLENPPGVWPWPANQLPSVIGELRNDRLVARSGIPGYLSYGPYVQIPSGRIEYTIVYSSEANPGVEVGVWDIVSSAVESPETLAKGILSGTEGKEHTLHGILNLNNSRPLSEIRTFSHGAHDLQLIRIEIKVPPPSKDGLK